MDYPVEIKCDVGKLKVFACSVFPVVDYSRVHWLEVLRCEVVPRLVTAPRKVELEECGVVGEIADGVVEVALRECGRVARLPNSVRYLEVDTTEAVVPEGVVELKWLGAGFPELLPGSVSRLTVRPLEHLVLQEGIKWLCVETVDNSVAVEAPEGLVTLELLHDAHSTSFPSSLRKVTYIDCKSVDTTDLPPTTEVEIKEEQRWAELFDESPESLERVIAWGYALKDVPKEVPFVKLVVSGVEKIPKVEELRRFERVVLKELDAADYSSEELATLEQVELHNCPVLKRRLDRASCLAFLGAAFYKN
jgi:hypothetical protein